MPVNNFFDTPTYYDVMCKLYTPSVIDFTLPRDCWRWVKYETGKTYTSKEQYGLAYDAVNNYVLSTTTYEDVSSILRYVTTFKELQNELVSSAMFMLGLEKLKGDEGFTPRQCFISLPEPTFSNEHFILNEYAFKAIVDYFKGDMIKVMCFTNNKTYLESPIK